jgi:hypothetical protein
MLDDREVPVALHQRLGTGRSKIRIKDWGQGGVKSEYVLHE